VKLQRVQALDLRYLIEGTVGADNGFEVMVQDDGGVDGVAGLKLRVIRQDVAGRGDGFSGHGEWRREENKQPVQVIQPSLQPPTVPVHVYDLLKDFRVNVGFQAPTLNFSKEIAAGISVRVRHPSSIDENVSVDQFQFGGLFR